jgi:hypothetical protein
MFASGATGFRLDPGSRPSRRSATASRFLTTLTRMGARIFGTRSPTSRTSSIGCSATGRPSTRSAFSTTTPLATLGGSDVSALPGRARRGGSRRRWRPPTSRRPTPHRQRLPGQPRPPETTGSGWRSTTIRLRLSPPEADGSGSKTRNRRPRNRFVGSAVDGGRARCSAAEVSPSAHPRPSRAERST